MADNRWMRTGQLAAGRPARAFAAGVAISMLTLLAACGGGGDTGGSASPAPTQVTQTIGAAGGTIQGPGGVTLTIPADALTADTPLTIALDGSGAPPPPAGSTQHGPMIALLPHGTSFNAPVQITVAFDAAQFPAGQLPILLKTNEQRDGWQQLRTLVSGNTLTAWITGFSYTAVIRPMPSQFLAHPRDCAVIENGWCFFRASAGGDAPFTYQWLRNGVTVPGETNEMILVNPARAADDGALYSVEATSRNGATIVSNSARLTVSPLPPVIANHPIDVQVVEGSPATFSAASTSSVAQALQWKRCDTGVNCGATTADWGPVTHIAGAQSPSYTLPNALFTDHGARFALCASNRGGTTCSREARLSVISQAVQPVITSPPRSITVRAGASASFTVQATGGALSYEWSDSRDGVTFAPRPACGNSATCTISNTVQGDSGTNFRVRVFNAVGAAVSTPPALLTVQRAPTLAPTRVGGGLAHSIALRGNGTLVAWGANNYGQLGRGTVGAPGDPGQVSGLAGVATFAVGGDHNFALLDNGEVRAWGRNHRAQLGFATGSAPEVRPVPASPDVGPARHIAAAPIGGNPGPHSLAVLANNPLTAAWGSNLSGQLGNGLADPNRTPELVPNLSFVTRVAAGGGFSLALRQDGMVWAWGSNECGQLGLANAGNVLTPTPIPGLARVIQIAAGSRFSLAIDEDGDVWAWGANDRGQLGNGSRTAGCRAEPQRISLPMPATAIAAGNAHAVALLEDGRVFAWGDNAEGQVGADMAEPYMLVPTLVGSPLPGGIVAVGTGWVHTLAVDSNFDVWAWGFNGSGQLGDGTTQERSTPARVPGVNLR